MGVPRRRYGSKKRTRADMRGAAAIRLANHPEPYAVSPRQLVDMMGGAITIRDAEAIIAPWHRGQG